MWTACARILQDELARIKDIETIPWKVCANDFYSRIAMRWKKNTKKQQQPKKKKDRLSATYEWVFFMHSNEWIKVVQALSMVYCFYFIHTEIFPCWTTYFKDWKPLRANVIMNTNRRLVKRGLVKRGLVKRGLEKQELVKRGLVNHFCFCMLRHRKFGFN